jgi:hypothetical protein
VIVQDANGNPVKGLRASDFQITENGRAIRDATVNEAKVGLQLAIVVDASGTINLPGQTKMSRIDEVREALKGLLLSGQWVDSQDRTDWISLIVQEEKGNSVLTIDQDFYPKGWTNDYQFGYNAIYEYDSTRLRPDSSTPLFDVIFKAFSLIGDGPAELAQKGALSAIVVFSDGIDIMSDTQLDDVVKRARAANLPVHTVLLGGSSADDGARNLRRLAVLTGGQTAQYRGISSLDAIYSAVGARRNQYAIRYRMTAAGDHAVQIRASANGMLVSDAAQFKDGLQRATVAVTAPAARTVFERTPNEPTQTISITLNVAWPDGRPRAIAEAWYYLDDTQFSVTRAPFEQFVLTARNLAAGPHSIRAGVRDEFDLRAESVAVPIEIHLLKPLEISFVNPPPAAVIRREARPSWGFWIKTPDIEPRNQVVEIRWQAVDGRKRDVRAVEFLVDGQPYPPLQGSMNMLDWDISRLDSGVHILQARLEDQLGIIAESSPLPVSIIVKPALTIGPVTLLSLAVAVVSLALALYLFIRRPTIITTVAERVVSRVKEITEPFFPKAQPDGKKAVVAELAVEEGDNSYLTPIPIYSGGNIRLGRDPALAKIVFQDRSVSRLHAWVGEEPDGAFRIRDEGSTSGTFVNYSPIPVEGHVLQNNDVIHLGRVRLRFNLAGSKTVPFTPLAPGAPPARTGGESQTAWPRDASSAAQRSALARDSAFPPASATEARHHTAYGAEDASAPELADEIKGATLPYSPASEAQRAEMLDATQPIIIQPPVDEQSRQAVEGEMLAEPGSAPQTNEHESDASEETVPMVPLRPEAQAGSLSGEDTKEKTVPFIIRRPNERGAPPQAEAANAQAAPNNASQSEADAGIAGRTEGRQREGDTVSTAPRRSRSDKSSAREEGSEGYRDPFGQ